jgi:hypothetical protein
VNGILGHRGLLLGGGGGGGSPPAVPEAASILAALRAWWPMDENNSGSTYADVHNGHNLSVRTGANLIATSTVSSATAKKDRAFNCAQVDNRCAYIPRSNTALDMPDADFSFGGWFRCTIAAASTAAFVMGRVGDNVTTRIQAYIYVENDTTIRAAASTDGTIGGRVVVNLGGIHSNTEYQLMVFTFNRTSNQIEFRLRRPSHNSGNMVKGTTSFPNPLFTTANDSNFTISEGLRNDTNFFSNNRSAVTLADECFFVDKALTDDEFNYLYNAGNGIDYAQLVADGS